MKKLINIVQSFLYYRLYIKLYIEKYLYKIQPYRIRKYIKKIQQKKIINVVFLPMNVAMWKYQHLYDLLKEDNRFHLYIFLSPAKPYTFEQRCKDLQEMRTYFYNRDMSFIDYELEKGGFRKHALFLKLQR